MGCVPSCTVSPANRSVHRLSPKARGLEVIVDEVPVFATRPKLDLSDLENHEVSGYLKLGDQFYTDYSLFGGYWLHIKPAKGLPQGWIFRKVLDGLEGLGKAESTLKVGKVKSDGLLPDVVKSMDERFAVNRVARVNGDLFFQKRRKGSAGTDYGLTRYNTRTQVYPFVCVADEDKHSRVFSPRSGRIKTWKSELKHCILSCKKGKYWSVTRRSPQEFRNACAGDDSGRGLELSELVWFDQRLLTMDDRTGVLLEFVKGLPEPKFFLDTVHGGSKGFKAEWAVQKGPALLIGSHGNVNLRKSLPMQLINMKTLDITVLDAEHVFSTLHDACIGDQLRLEGERDALKGAYLTHECCAYSKRRGKFFFAPRQVAWDPYTKESAGRRGSNLLAITALDFDFSRNKVTCSDVQLLRVGKENRLRGFSALAFLPDSNENILMALKSTECEVNGEEVIESFVTVFELFDDDRQTRTLVEDIPLGQVKYEGVSFI